MYYRYILQSANDQKFYTGLIENLKLRFEQHEKGLVDAMKNKRHLKLIYYEACLDQEDGVWREKCLKSYVERRF